MRHLWPDVNYEVYNRKYPDHEFGYSAWLSSFVWIRAENKLFSYYDEMEKIMINFRSGDVPAGLIIKSHVTNVEYAFTFKRKTEVLGIENSITWVYEPLDEASPIKEVVVKQLL